MSTPWTQSPFLLCHEQFGWHEDKGNVLITWDGDPQGSDEESSGSDEDSDSSDSYNNQSLCPYMCFYILFICHVCLLHDQKKTWYIL